jgi:hypothetical protein
MRRRMIAGIVVLALAACVCVASLIYINAVIDQMDEACAQAYDAFRQQDPDLAMERTVRLAEICEKNRPFLEALTSHEDIHNVAEQYVMAKTSLELEQTDDYMMAMALLAEMLEHIREQEAPSWSNVF